MEGDDALESVLRVEGAALQHLGRRRLDAQTQVDHGVDARVGADQVQYLGNRVAGLAARQIDRVVAAPARRDHRVDACPDLLGQRDQIEPHRGAGVGGEHTPAPRGGEHDHATAGGQRLRRQGGCPLVGLLDGRRAQHAELAAHAVEDPVVAGERARVARRRPLALGGDAALHEHQWLARREGAHRLDEAAAVGNALQVGQRDIRLRVDGEVLQVVGHGVLRRVAGGDRLADADARLDCVVEERRHQVAALARHRDAAGRGIRRDDLGAHRIRRRDHPLAVGSGEQHAQLVGDGDELALERAPLLARLAVASARDERGAHSLAGAGPQQLDVRLTRRAREDEVRSARGDIGHVRMAGAAEDLSTLPVHREDLSLVAEAQQVVEGDESELAGMPGGAGDHDAAGMEERPEALEHRGVRALVRGARGARLRLGIEHHQRVDGDGQAVPHDERIDVDAAHVGTLDGEAAQADDHLGQALLVQRRLAAEGLGQQPAGAEPPQQAARFGGAHRRRGEDHVAERLGQHAAEAEHHAGTELRVLHQARDQLAVAAHQLRHQQRRLAVLGASLREQLAGGAPHGVRRVEPESHQAALALVGDCLPAELEHHREAQLGGGVGGGLGGIDQRFASTRDAVAGEKLLRRVLREGLDGGHAGPAA